MNDKIIQFPGARPEAQQAHQDQAIQPSAEQIADAIDYAKDRTDESVMSIVGPDGVPVPLSPDQQKAMQLIMSQVSFVMVGLKPTAIGCDFFTAVHGDKTDLSNASDELGNVIGRALSRKGII